MKALQKFVGSSAHMVKIHAWLAVFWAVNVPLVVVLYFFLPDAWQAASILYLALVSIYANFATHVGGWQSARVEVTLTEASEQDVAQEVTDRIVEQTDVQAVDK